jgi:predicted ABC-type sugar transport system permease subunit
MENQKVKKVFRSRISVLLLGFLLAIFIPTTIPIIKDMIISGLFIVGGTLLFIVLLFSGMRYIISDNKLYVKIGIIPYGSVKIANIVSIERSYNLLSSPAASLKRLRLGIGRGATFSYMLISPVREQEFIDNLKAINPTINVNVSVKKGVCRIQDWDI